MLGYAGISEALRIFFGLKQALGEQFDFRIIATDIEFSDQLVPESGAMIADLHDDGQSSFVYSDGTQRRFQNLALRQSDIFIATAWWTAAHAKRLARQQSTFFGQPKKKFIYLIQDYECGFYAWSSRSALAESTYRQADDFFAIFNTPILQEYFAKNDYDIAGAVYKPPMNEEIVRHIDRSVAKQKIVLIYMRPSAHRNCLEFANAVVHTAKRSDPLFWREWTFVAIGEKIDGSDLPNDSLMENRGRLSLREYGDLLSRAMIGLSFMVSPHPSYPPLEMAAAGMRVLTNTYANKNLSRLHGNIHSFDVFDTEQVARQLRGIAEDAVTSGPVWDASRIDWFFDGKTNLGPVIEQTCAEIMRQI
ncbi:MAG: hypothetical protein PGN34_20615 [Methylobacterium frigidaeris]